MGGFLSFFIGDNSDSIFYGKEEESSDKEILDFLLVQAEELIGIWMRRYIEMYDPQYTFEQISESIDIINITDTSIEFSITLPFTGLKEVFQF